MSTASDELAEERRIFEQAIEIDSPTEREAWLIEACGKSRELLKRLRKLLDLHEREDRHLDRVPAFSAEDLAPEEQDIQRTGTTIGPYEVMEVLGAGGMGVVYRARQTEPIQREVALKVLRSGQGSREVLARFAAEREALAMMEHPNIARILDAGASREDAPYIVMEWVRGEVFTKYCEERALDLKQRLQLFIPICHAIHHAHQKGVIHRDIKPSNVLVTQRDGRPVPVVIDFGVAKAVEQPLTEETFNTKLGHVIGTLQYMSP
ncbi:MAG: serine/threonine-protein kinase, partial [Verrucomicrobiota bacterium]